jgi:hypothetical protein
MGTILKSLLADSKNEHIWQAIADKRLEYARASILNRMVVQHKTFLGFLKKPQTSVDHTVMQLALEILSSGPYTKPPQIKLLLNKNGSESFAELIRLLFSFHYNGYFGSQVAILKQMVLDILSDLTKQVSSGAGNYPNNGISGYIWTGGASIREWCEPLALFFEQTNDLTRKAEVLEHKCSITLSIMNHYPYTLGADMIETGLAKEAAGQTSHAKRYYAAVIKCLEQIVTEIQRYPEEVVWEEQIICLQSLRCAYEHTDSLNNTTQYISQILAVENIIKRRVSTVVQG